MKRKQMFTLKVSELKEVSGEFPSREIIIPVRDGMAYLWYFATKADPNWACGWVSYAQEPFDKYHMIGKVKTGHIPKKLRDAVGKIQVASSIIQKGGDTLRNKLDVSLEFGSLGDRPNVRISSSRMNCDYYTSPKRLLTEVVSILREYEDLVEAEMI